MSIYTFTNPITGQRFEVETPATFTEAQARQIFEQQLNAGSLVGLKPGDVINSASQLAGGLKTAASQVSQSIAGIAGSTQGALTGALDKAKQAASALPGQNLLASAQSVASKTLSGITATVTNLVPTNPINIANLAQQATSLVPIQGMSQVDVRAAMSQVTALVGQAANVVTNNKGLGQFGFDAAQLERAGVLKPGTASTYLANGTANLTSVLNSPAVWTGVNGVNNLDSLLASVPTQNLIQQDLMSQGLNAVKNLGIPTDRLNPGALAGTALNAAKSITNTMSWAKGMPLPSGVKGLLDQTARSGAFAVDFAGQAANDAVLQQDPAAPATDTANRDTVDAAATRVTGNDKIPSVNYGSVEADRVRVESMQRFSDEVSAAVDTYRALNQRVSNLIKTAPNSQTGTDPQALSNAIEQYALVLADYTALEGNLLALERQAQAYQQRYGSLPARFSTLQTTTSQVQSAIKNIEAYIGRLRARLETLNAQQ